MLKTKKTVHAFPPLANPCKARFPFTIACPSFVYPAGYVENVRRLAPFVDEIQLLFFESAPQSLPSAALIQELAALADHGKIGYNVHLPTDIYPGHPDPEERRRAVDALRTVVACCRTLRPSTFTLHLERNPTGTAELPIDRWRRYLLDSLEGMLPPEVSPRKFAVETLDYPLEWVAPVIAAADLSVCMDMGHLMIQKADLGAFYETWKQRLTTVHLHGVDGTDDHLPLDRLSNGRMRTVLRLLKDFEGVVVVENYSPTDLNRSLACLAAGWSGRKAAGT